MPQLTAFYDPWYVLLSIVLAVLSAYAALDLAARVQQSRASGTRTIWLACGALALGSGIWSMHYVGMLAFCLPVPIQYDELRVALSLLAAVASSGIALFLASRRTMNLLTTAMGSIFLGGGIASMHYIGMAAMRTAAMPMYSTGTVALSVVLAVLIAFIALRATFAHRHITHAFTWRKAILATIMGAAIPSVHYVGMAAATWHTMPGTQTAITGPTVVFTLWGVLAVPLAACALLICLVWLNATVDATLNAQVQHQLTSEERYRNILSSAFDAFIGISPRGIITDWNTQAERTFGWTAGEVIGTSIDGLLQFNNISFTEYLDAHTRYEVEGRIEVQGRHKFRGAFPAEMALSVLDVDNSLLVAAFVHDVTERKLAEQQTQQARRAAEAANRAKSEFLANMSHEIRTPLNGIIGMNDLVLDSDLTSDQRECLETVRLSADLLLAVISDILDFSKIEAGKLELESVRFDLRECIETTVKTMALRADEKGLELLCDIALDAPDAIFSDPARLRQVLTNLIGNAIKFTPHGEIMVQVRTSTHLQKPALHFTVSDTGIGIAPAKLSSIFEPFRQADTSTTRQFGGTGLGLTISRHTVQMFGGRMWVESEPGNGSHFHFIIPVQVATPIECLPVTPRTCASLAGIRALVIDDNRTNLRILQGLLTRWHMRPTIVLDGATALTTLRNEAAAGDPFRLVLTDVHMPEMDGFAFVEELKSSSLEAPTIMMLSSAGQRGDAARCRALGVAAYLLKPVRPRELQDAIARVLDMQSTPLITNEPSRPSMARQAARTHTPAMTNNIEVTITDNALNVLLAEDNEVNRKLATRVLERRGHRVTTVVNGLEAVDAILTASSSFDLVLMDVQMPEMSGIEATEAIRRNEQNTARHQRIVAMTALVMTGDRERCIASGMDDYISKPFRPEELDNILEQALHLKHAKQSRTLPATPLPAALPAPHTASSIDTADLFARIGDDTDLLQELTQILEDDTPAKLAALHAACESSNARSLRETAHSLKGALATLGAHHAAEQAATLESMGRNNNIASARQLIDTLREEIQRVHQQLRALCTITLAPEAAR